MNKQIIIESIEAVYFEELAEGVDIQRVDFLAWPYFCLDLEVKFSLSYELGLLDKQLIFMKKQGLGIKEIEFVAGLDKQSVEEIVGENSDARIKRSGTFFIPDVFYNRVFGNFVIDNENRRFSNIHGITKSTFPVKRMWPIKEFPTPEEIPVETINSIIDCRPEILEWIGEASLDIQKVESVYKNIRLPVQFSLICFLCLGKEGTKTKKVFDFYARADIPLSQMEINELERRYLTLS